MENEIDKDKKNSQDMKITDCSKYRQEGFFKGYCKQFEIKCTYVCDYFFEK